MFLTSWLRRPKRRPRPASGRRTARPRGLCLETLECRTLLSFFPAVHIPLPGAGFFQTANAEVLATGDFTGTGKMDIVTSNHGTGKLSVLLGNGDGTFQAAENYTAGPPASAPDSVAVGNFFGNARIDVAVTDANTGLVGVLPGSGDGTFGPVDTFFAAEPPSGMVTADLTGSGFDDLAVSSAVGNTVNVLLNTSDGAPTSAFAPLGSLDRLAAGSPTRSPLGPATPPPLPQATGAAHDMKVDEAFVSLVPPQASHLHTGSRLVGGRLPGGALWESNGTDPSFGTWLAPGLD